MVESMQFTLVGVSLLDEINFLVQQGLEISFEAIIFDLQVLQSTDNISIIYFWMNEGVLIQRLLFLQPLLPDELNVIFPVGQDFSKMLPLGEQSFVLLSDL